MLIREFWFPEKYFYFGGLKALALIASIDLILGPTLTLIVYNPNKKRLKWDLTIIAAIQLSALTYGIVSIDKGRPIIQVLSYDGLHIVSKSEVSNYSLDVTSFIGTNHETPSKVYMDLPKKQGDIQKVEIITGFIDGTPLYLRQDLFKQFPVSLDRPYLKSDTKDGCIKVDIYSLTHSAKGCIDPTSGSLIEIREIRASQQD